MKTIFKNNIYFLLPYSLFLLTAGIVLVVNSKTSIHLTLNTFHNSFFDSFFFYATYLGDGVMALIVSIMLLAVRYRFVLIVGLSNIIASLITQLLKHNVFDEALRPVKYFEGIHDLYLVPGVENFSHNSFPSGHSTCAFALYFSLALLVRNNALKLLFFVIALTVGYSRIYLSQHFLEDVYAGSLIGVVITMLVYQISQNIKPGKWDKSLISSL